MLMTNHELQRTQGKELAVGVCRGETVSHKMMDKAYRVRFEKV